MSKWDPFRHPRNPIFLLFFPFITPSLPSLPPPQVKSFRPTTENMASTDQSPGPTTAKGYPTEPPLGSPMSMSQKAIDAGAEMLQSLKPINQFSVYGCSFGIYSHDMNRQIETHHFCSRLSQDFVQSVVYASNECKAPLLGVEYVVSDKLYETFPPEEQKLWHSHAYEIKSGLRVNPRVPEMIALPELENFTKTYGKFWCTWQYDRGDKLPMGAPALMMSPQAVSPGIVRPELVHERDAKFGICHESFQSSRMEIEEPEMINPLADYWKQHDKGFAIDFEETEMKRTAPFP